MIKFDSFKDKKITFLYLNKTCLWTDLLGFLLMDKSKMTNFSSMDLNGFLMFCVLENKNGKAQFQM